MKILFLHGWHSVPGGVKPTHLESLGHEVIQPQLDDDDFDAAVSLARAEVERYHPDLIVGSSRGGAVAMNLLVPEIPLVLLCPAWKRWGAARRLPPNSVILHSPEDDVIPFADSEELVAASHLPAETLIEVGHDHRLADDESLGVLGWLCDLHAANRPLPWLENPTEPPEPNRNGPAVTPAPEASYLCDGCGETIVIPLDLTEGSHQSYVEDCPVCCRASLIHVDIDSRGRASVRAEPEQDRCD